MALRLRLRKHGLEDPMGFGKSPETKVRVLIMNDFRYMAWMLENKHIFLDATAMKVFKEQEELQEDDVSEDPGDDLYNGGLDWGGDGKR